MAWSLGTQDYIPTEVSTAAHSSQRHRRYADISLQTVPIINLVVHINRNEKFNVKQSSCVSVTAHICSPNNLGLSKRKRLSLQPDDVFPSTTIQISKKSAQTLACIMGLLPSLM